MALPNDAYPLTDSTGVQITPDFVKPVSLSSTAITSTAATAVNPTVLKPNESIIFYTTIDCILRFDGIIASSTPLGELSLLLLAGERGAIIIPDSVTGLSIIGINTGDTGVLYIQKLIKWAGLANEAAGVVS